MSQIKNFVELDQKYAHPWFDLLRESFTPLLLYLDENRWLIMLSFLVASMVSFVILRKRRLGKLYQAKQLKQKLPPELRKLVPSSGEIKINFNIEKNGNETLSDFCRTLENIELKINSKREKYELDLVDFVDNASEMNSKGLEFKAGEVLTGAFAEMGIFLKAEKKQFAQALVMNFYSVSTMIDVLLASKFPPNLLRPQYSISHLEKSSNDFSLNTEGFVGSPIMGEGGPDKKYTPAKLKIWISNVMGLVDDEEVYLGKETATVTVNYAVNLVDLEEEK